MILLAFATGASVLAGAPTGASGGRSAHADGPPAGRTGGFGEPTCAACHAEYPLNLTGGSLSLEGWPDAYEPGQAYTLTVVLDAPDMARAGFQLAVRDAQGVQAGRLEPVDGRVAVQDSLGIGYAQHAFAGTDVSDGRVASWTLTWVAPTWGGPVRAHAAANSANGDNSPFGDLIYTGTWGAVATVPRR